MSTEAEKGRGRDEKGVTFEVVIVGVKRKKETAASDGETAVSVCGLLFYWN
jgi:hypothetical protein